MTKIVERTNVQIQSFEVDGIFGRMHSYAEQYEDVEDVAIYEGILEFTTKGLTTPNSTQRIQTNRPFSVTVTQSLDCGHKLESYYEDDGGNAGTFPGCKECDAMPTGKVTY